MLNIKPFQRLTVKQWWWLWCAYWCLWPTNLRIKFKQGAWLRSKIYFASAIPVAGKHSAIEQKRYFDALLMHESVRLAARLHFLPAECLPKSIVLVDMLRRRSYAAEVRIGVSKSAEKLASHAWVEVDGCMLAEPENVVSDFTAIKH